MQMMSRQDKVEELHHPQKIFEGQKLDEIMEGESIKKTTYKD